MKDYKLVVSSLSKAEYALAQNMLSVLKAGGYAGLKNLDQRSRSYINKFGIRHQVLMWVSLKLPIWWGDSPYFSPGLLVDSSLVYQCLTKILKDDARVTYGMKEGDFFLSVAY